MVEGPHLNQTAEARGTQGRQGETPSFTPIIDTHVHLWDPRRLRYPWLVDIPALNRPFLPEDYRAASAEAPPAKFVVVECGCDSALSSGEVRWVSELARIEPRLRGIIAHAPLERGMAVRDQLVELAKDPLVKGVRRLLQGETAAEFCLQPEFVAGVRLLAEFDFTFDVCIRHEQLPAVTELARRCPEVTFVLDHLGKPPVRSRVLDPWRAQFTALAAQPNVACKISGLTTEANRQDWRPGHLRPYLAHALANFGFRRVLFGSDWPVCTLAATWERWLETVQAAVSSVSDAERHQFFQTNAERIYDV
jgi:L-fuconolactonase